MTGPRPRPKRRPNANSRPMASDWLPRRTAKFSAISGTKPTSIRMMPVVPLRSRPM
jgi:hypothetical protein